MISIKSFITVEGDINKLKNENNTLKIDLANANIRIAQLENGKRSKSDILVSFLRAPDLPMTPVLDDKYKILYSAMRIVLAMWTVYWAFSTVGGYL
jgi:hypothetical protein